MPCSGWLAFAVRFFANLEGILVFDAENAVPTKATMQAAVDAMWSRIGPRMPTHIIAPPDIHAWMWRTGEFTRVAQLRWCGQTHNVQPDHVFEALGMPVFRSANVHSGGLDLSSIWDPENKRAHPLVVPRSYRIENLTIKEKP